MNRKYVPADQPFKMNRKYVPADQPVKMNWKRKACASQEAVCVEERLPDRFIAQGASVGFCVARGTVIDKRK
eukprot:507742-Pelagomonas_calceolata.AAC.16